MTYRGEQNSSASVRVEDRFVGSTKSLNEVGGANNQPPPSFVCLRVLSRFRKCVKGHTFVSRITAATADNNTTKAAHTHDSQGKTHENVR